MKIDTINLFDIQTSTKVSFYGLFFWTVSISHNSLSVRMLWF